MPEVIDRLEGKVLRCVVYAGCDGCDAGNGKDAREDLEFHRNEVREDQTWAVD